LKDQHITYLAKIKYL